MDGQATRIVTYITWIGFLIAIIFCKDKNDPLTKFHLNQSLVIHIGLIIASVIAIIPIIGWIVGGIAWVILFVDWIIGLVGAIQGAEKKAPLIGNIKLLK